jgi:hypothetical protein
LLVALLLASCSNNHSQSLTTFGTSPMTGRYSRMRNHLDDSRRCRTPSQIHLTIPVSATECPLQFSWGYQNITCRTWLRETPFETHRSYIRLSRGPGRQVVTTRSTNTLGLAQAPLETSEAIKNLQTDFPSCWKVVPF